MRLKVFQIVVLILFINIDAKAEEKYGNDISVSVGYARGVGLFVPVSSAWGVYFSPRLIDKKSDGVSNGYRYFAFTIGIRKYTELNNRYQKFFDFDLKNSKIKREGGNEIVTGNQTTFSYGLQYYIDRNISLEGKLGIGFRTSKSNNKKITTLIVPSHEIALSYHFN